MEKLETFLFQSGPLGAFAIALGILLMFFVVGGLISDYFARKKARREKEQHERAFDRLFRTCGAYFDYERAVEAKSKKQQ